MKNYFNKNKIRPLLKNQEKEFQVKEFNFLNRILNETN